MTPELVIFDCDGVLVDTEPLTDRVIADSLTRHGLPTTPDDVKTMFRGGTIGGVADSAREQGASLPDDWVDQTYAAIFDALARGVPVIEGVIALIDRLETLGIAVAVASNGPRHKMEISLGPSGLWDRLKERTYSGHDHGPKPAPDMLVRAAADNGIAPARGVMIDDSPAGVTAGLAAGMAVIGFTGTGNGTALAALDVPKADTMAEVARLLFPDD